MIEISYLNEKEMIKFLPQEVQIVTQNILEILDTEYGADRNDFVKVHRAMEELVRRNNLI